ncbi:phosphoribosylanthranilate isomerase [Qipengyuania vesicularis]|uniref:phosphoribosylanthranilate isomerase n=1 Tax=Qipengyuania vesicularis TaxID=2867232 RepID=UPI001C88825F|nr:phosphoribosylanthranilate isomerase [Qipengyuania vesicularis]MBX7527065.1 phosphoribosylanthranilate isomerase [Qipengyuania vesicularis]
MPTAIKICGISSVEALDAAIEARADYIGLVFFPPSPRHVDAHAASALAMRAGARIGRVGLFVDADDGLIAEGIASGRLDAVQLHGEETPKRVAEVKGRFKLPVWKAISVASAGDVAAAETYRDVADLLLFDAKTPKDAALPGGMGLRFDWSLLKGWKGRHGWGLAGGLTPANVADAVAQSAAPLVDTSSGVESAPGIKDAALIRSFCEAARSI